MALMDDMDSKMGNVKDELMQKYNNLRQKEQNGELDDNGKEELSQIRSRLNL